MIRPKCASAANIVRAASCASIGETQWSDWSLASSSLVCHRVDDEIDAEFETFRRRFKRVLRLIDPFPEIADVVVETDNDRKIALVIIDAVERGAAAHLVRRFNIDRFDVVIGVKDP